jgi:glycosyltransferase involved in cell wall biosynthesis
MTEKEILRFKDTRFLFAVNTLKTFGGAERQALILASYIKANVSEHVTFIAFEDGTNFRSLLEVAGIQVWFFPFKHHTSKHKKILRYYQLVKFIRLFKPDLLLPYVAESNKIVAQTWKYTGAQFAFWNQREEGRKLYGTALEQNLIRKVSAIVSNSFEGADALKKTYKLSDKDITVINNGIAPHNQEFITADWHQELGIETNRPIVSMIANITDRKDHETLLKAWAIVILACKQKNLELPFLILAGRKAETYDKLRLLAFDLNLSNHIGFTDYVSPNNVKDITSQSLFCVFSSNLEGCPNGVLECMEQSKVVIGTNISGVVQALGNKYNSQCLSEPNNAEDLASKIISLYEKPSLLVEIGQYNKQRINTEFSVKKMANSYLDLIKIKIQQA